MTGDGLVDYGMQDERQGFEPCEVAFSDVSSWLRLCRVREAGGPQHADRDTSLVPAAALPTSGQRSALCCRRGKQ